MATMARTCLLATIASMASLAQVECKEQDHRWQCQSLDDARLLSTDVQGLQELNKRTMKQKHTRGCPALPICDARIHVQKTNSHTTFVA